MTNEELMKEILSQAEPVCVELGLEIVAVDIKGISTSLAIQVLADRPLGGIGLDECSTLNRRLDEILYNKLNLGDNYTLEVSSPGLDRWLFGYQDLRRVSGRDVQIMFSQPFNKKHEVTGTLKAVRESDVIVQVKKEEWVIPMDKIKKSKQVII